MSNHLMRIDRRAIVMICSVFFALLVLAGCGSKDTEKQLSAEERFSLGMKYFNKEDYLDAIEEFKVVALQFQTTKYADAAQFYLAESRFRREEYVLAAFEYDVLLRTMPSSPYASRARFRRATCFFDLSPKSYLDQIYTRKAIDEYQAFLEYFPTDSLVPMAEVRISELNTKLARKVYENGLTYMYMEYYKAAAFYFDLVLEKYHDTPYAEPALLQKAEALTDRKRYAEAKEEIERFLSKYPASTMRADAEKLRAKIDKGIAESKEMKQKPPEPILDTSKQAQQPGS